MVGRRSTNSIALDRTFLEVPDAADGVEPEQMLRVARALNRGQSWSQLLEHPYVVVLGEAGTGKSTEFERQADELTTSGQWAFFAEINDLAGLGLGDSIESDDEERLKAWWSTDKPAFLFLDSLDEAKLQKNTLRQALRRLVKELRSEWARVRLVISCRASDWMGDADRAEVEAVIPKQADARVHVVQLAPLEDGQIQKLAGHVGVADVAAFMVAIKENYAQVFVERPLDVTWLGVYWSRHQRIGNLRELVQDNIREKLKERVGRGSRNSRHLLTTQLAQSLV